MLRLSNEEASLLTQLEDGQRRFRAFEPVGWIGAEVVLPPRRVTRKTPLRDRGEVPSVGIAWHLAFAPFVHGVKTDAEELSDVGSSCHDETTLWFLSLLPFFFHASRATTSL